MPKPQGRLTDSQLEIMEVLWAAPKGGLKTTEVWTILSKRRAVARTTILTLLRRLEQRGWIARVRGMNVVRYRAVITSEQAASNLAVNVLDEYFDGSASRLVSSLLGSGRIKKAELKRLRRLLDEKGRP